MPGFGSLMPDWSGVGEALPEASDQDVNPIIKVGKKALNLGTSVVKGLVDTAAQTPYGLRREDVTDIPGSGQPIDPLVAQSTGVASGLIGGPAVEGAAAGPIRSAAVKQAAAVPFKAATRRPAASSIAGAGSMPPDEAPVPTDVPAPASGAAKAAQTPSGRSYFAPDVGALMPENIGSDRVLDPLGAMAIGAGKIAMAPGQAYQSKVPITTAQMIKPAADLAGMTTLGAGAVPAEANALRAGAKIASEAPTFGRLYAPTAGESGIINAGVDAPINPKIQTVGDPYRMMFPGVYANPREIAAEAAARVGPEDPAMKRLFGVTRGDLWDMSQDRRGNIQPPIPEGGPRSRGSEAGRRVMTPENTQRLQDILGEAGQHEGLRNADAWYNMDPVFDRQAQMFGPAQAVPRYSHFNTMTGMASPGSDVMTEIQRGTAAHWLEQQGRFDDFMRYAGVPEEERGHGAFPEDMMYIGGHPYHGTSQALPMQKYLAAGRTIQSTSPKVPLYTSASGVPETGFQTRGPVGDAHWSRGVGLADVRKGPTDVQASFSTPEYQTLQPWWQHQVADPVGLESVPAQARLWTALGPQTGVESALGAPKLELLSKQIMTAAHRLGVSPETARDYVLSGKAGAGVLAGGILGAGGFGSLRPPSAEERQ